MMSAVWDVELEPEVDEWLSRLPIAAFATAAFHTDRLAEQGPAVRMPHSRSLGEELFELRFFYLDRIAQRITYFFAGDGRLVLLTEFRKQRMSEGGRSHEQGPPWPDVSGKATQPRRMTDDADDMDRDERGSPQGR